MNVSIVAICEISNFVWDLGSCGRELQWQGWKEQLSMPQVQPGLSSAKKGLSDLDLI